MATRRFTEYVVHTRTYYKAAGEQKRAEHHAQAIADETGKPYRMKILRGWIQEDPSGFVYDSEVTSERHKIFRPHARSLAANRRRNPRSRHRDPQGYWSISAAHARRLLGGGTLPRPGYERITSERHWLVNWSGRYYYHKPGDPRYDAQVKTNPWEPGLSRTWYSRGYQAGASGRYADMYGAWHAAKNKPRTPGGRVTAQESFYQGFMDTKRMFNSKWQPAHVRVNNHGQVQIRVTNPKSRRLGGGGKMASCVRQVAARGGAYDPKAVCAAAGMRKYGKARMQRWAAAGRRRAMRTRNRRRY